MIRSRVRMRGSGSNVIIPRQTLQEAGFSNVVAQWESTLASSYSGTGNTFANIASAPADGSAQSAYDLTLTSLTFNGAAGDVGAYFSTAGLGYARIAANTPFLRDLHKTTGASDYGLLIIYEAGTTGTGMLISTKTSTNDDGIEIQTATNITHRQSNGVATSNVSGGTIAATTPYLLVVGHSAAGATSIRALNSRTRTEQAHTFGATTTDAANLFTLFARSPVAIRMPSGSRLKSAVLLNVYPDNALINSLVNYYNNLHAATYA